MTQNAPLIDAHTFIEHLLQSDLLETDAMNRLATEGPHTDDALEVARFLVRQQLLTRYQAEQILGGQSTGFKLGQYRILDELGRGGMGRVYKAVHQTMGRTVALKVLAPSLTKTPKSREQFRQEIRAAAKLNHPNIVTAYDANQAGDACFLVMEYVDGPNLSDLVKQRGPLPLEQACEFIRQTAFGLANAHEQHLVHRDIKPANLIVQTTSAGPIVKILDFGLARIIQPNSQAEQSAASGELMMAGTPDYVAPEQARNQARADGRSDLYSLGCTFYYLLTGTVPFPGGTAIEKLVRHYSDEPTDIRHLRPEIPDGLAGIVHKLLAKKPTDRFQTAFELIDALNRLAVGKSDWHPPTPIPKSSAETSLRPAITTEDPWANLADDSIINTLPNVAASTRETASPRVPTQLAKQPPVNQNIIWMILLFCCVSSVLIGVIGLLRFLAARS